MNASRSPKIVVPEEAHRLRRTARQAQVGRLRPDRRPSRAAASLEPGRDRPVLLGRRRHHLDADATVPGRGAARRAEAPDGQQRRHRRGPHRRGRGDRARRHRRQLPDRRDHHRDGRGERHVHGGAAAPAGAEAGLACGPATGARHHVDAAAEEDGRADRLRTDRAGRRAAAPGLGGHHPGVRPVRAGHRLAGDAADDLGRGLDPHAAHERHARADRQARARR